MGHAKRETDRRHRCPPPCQANEGKGGETPKRCGACGGKSSKSQEYSALGMAREGLEPGPPASGPKREAEPEPVQPPIRLCVCRGLTRRARPTAHPDQSSPPCTLR